MFRNQQDYQKLCKTLAYKFKDRKLLIKALTRRSAVVEGLQSPDIGDFQRLEFIGDKVLNLVISSIIFDNHPDWNEGRLTIESSKFVNNKGPLAQIANNIGLGKYLIIGAGEEKNKARENIKVLSDALEALIGAIWLDSENDFRLIKGFITKQFRVLGLIDFNQDYAEKVMKHGFRALGASIAEMCMPEQYAAEGWGGWSLADLLEMKSAKKRATKPLKGFPSLMESYLEAAEHSPQEEESENSASDNSIGDVEEHSSTKTIVDSKVKPLLTAYSKCIESSLEQYGFSKQSRPLNLILDYAKGTNVVQATPKAIWL